MWIQSCCGTPRLYTTESVKKGLSHGFIPQSSILLCGRSWKKIRIRLELVECFKFSTDARRGGLVFSNGYISIRRTRARLCHRHIIEEGRMDKATDDLHFQILAPSPCLPYRFWNPPLNIRTDHALTKPKLRAVLKRAAAKNTASLVNVGNKFGFSTSSAATLVFESLESSSDCPSLKNVYPIGCCDDPTKTTIPTWRPYSVLFTKQLINVSCTIDSNISMFGLLKCWSLSSFRSTLAHEHNYRSPSQVFMS